MPLVVINRAFQSPSLRKIKWSLYGLANVPQVAGQYVPTRVVVVRNHFLASSGGRKKTLRIGLLTAGKQNKNVVLYRKLQWPEQRFPVFTPFKRHLKGLGQKVAPVQSQGTVSTGINVQHYLGLALMQLGGVLLPQAGSPPSPQVPDAPTIGTAVAGDTQASVAFTAPANPGSSPILTYTAVSTPGGFTASNPVSPIVVTGLTNGTAYTFKVVAINAVGTSAQSAASNSVTPVHVTGPAAPANLTLLKQSRSGSQLSWGSVTGASSYKVYRNGTQIATTSSTSFTDAGAPNTYVYTLDQLATPYTYTVSAVASGVEGTQSNTPLVWWFQGSAGGSNTSASDFSYGISKNWADTTGSPVGGGVDVLTSYTPGTGGGFQPYSNSPLVDDTYCFDINQFSRFRFDVKMQNSNFMYLAFYSRLPFGDIFTWKGQDVHLSDYITVVPNTWQTVDMPITDFNFGNCSFVGSIGAPYGTITESLNNTNVQYPYATLTITSKTGGAADVDCGGYILGTGLSDSVWVADFSQHATVGTFKVIGPGIGPVNGSTSVTVSSRAMSYSRTNAYKFNFGMPDGQPGGNVWLNNIGFY